MRRVIACGIPQGAGLNRTAEYRREQDWKRRNTGESRIGNGGIPQRAGQETAEYRREQDWKRRNTGESRTETAEYHREQD